MSCASITMRGVQVGVHSISAHDAWSYLAAGEPPAAVQAAASMGNGKEGERREGERQVPSSILARRPARHRGSGFGDSVLDCVDDVFGGPVAKMKGL